MIFIGLKTPKWWHKGLDLNQYKLYLIGKKRGFVLPKDVLKHTKFPPRLNAIPVGVIRAEMCPLMHCPHNYFTEHYDKNKNYFWIFKK